MKKELVVISHSGGLDSSTLFLKALNEGHTVLPITYKYGQANFIENYAQVLVTENYKTKFPGQILDTMSIDFTESIGSVVDTFKKNRDNGKMEEHNDLKYYMPSRNLLFMATAAVIGEIIAIDESYDTIHLGLGIHQHSDIYARDYWDISEEFANRLQLLMQLNDNVKVDIYAPYKNFMKSKIVSDAIEMDVPLQLTWTCYEPRIVSSAHNNTYIPCQECEACQERQTQADNVQTGLDINNYHIVVEH